jgi:hypothetical protein
VSASGKIIVTKLHAAVSQLETAITLWFSNGDPISIHTLTGAAHRIVLDLLEHQGKTTLSFDMQHIRPGKEKEFKRLLRAAETFFKHAKDDPEDTHLFNPEGTELYLFSAVAGYKELVHGQRVAILDLFSCRVYLTYPDFFLDPSIPETSKEPYIQNLLKGPRIKFFNELLPTFVRASVGASAST